MIFYHKITPDCILIYDIKVEFSFEKLINVGVGALDTIGIRASNIRNQQMADLHPLHKEWLKVCNEWLSFTD